MRNRRYTHIYLERQLVKDKALSGQGTTHIDLTKSTQCRIKAWFRLESELLSILLQTRMFTLQSQHWFWVQKNLIGYGSQLDKSIYDVNHFSLLLYLALKSAIGVDCNPIVKG